MSDETGGTNMKKEDMKKMLFAYNSILKEMDEVYRNAVKALGLGDCAFWILYTLREGGEMTQRKICDTVYMPKQTVNSALKKLEDGGFLELRTGKDRRSKQVRLTEKGVSLAERTADRVMLAECEALSELSEAELEAFIGLSGKYRMILKEKVGEINTKGEGI